MTVAVAGAARAAGVKSAAGASAGAAAKTSGKAAGARAGGKAPSSKGLNDAVRAGGEKTPPATTPEQQKTPERRLNDVTVNLPSPVGSGAGFVLALLAWTWIGVPLLQGGPTAVKNQLRAKFLNKAPDGSWLP